MSAILQETQAVQACRAGLSPDAIPKKQMQQAATSLRAKAEDRLRVTSEREAKVQAAVSELTAPAPTRSLAAGEAHAQDIAQLLDETEVAYAKLKTALLSEIAKLETRKAVNIATQALAKK